jgi:hypothetical protein
MTEDVEQNHKEDSIKFAKRMETTFSLGIQKYADANLPNPIPKSAVLRIWCVDFSELYLQARLLSFCAASALPPPPGLTGQ